MLFPPDIVTLKSKHALQANRPLDRRAHQRTVWPAAHTEPPFVAATWRTQNADGGSRFIEHRYQLGQRPCRSRSHQARMVWAHHPAPGGRR